MSGQEHPLPLIAAQQTKAFVDHTLTPTQTAYLCDREILQKFLHEKFPNVHDFKISTKNGRWYFRAPEQVLDQTVRTWIMEEQACREREIKARKEKARHDKAAKSGGAHEGASASSGATGA